jgi:hypothetical protein
MLWERESRRERERESHMIWSFVAGLPMLAWRCRWAKEEKHGARNSCPTLRASNPSTSCLLLQCTILPSITFSATNLPHHLCSQLDPHLWFQSSLTHQALSPLTIYSNSPPKFLQLYSLILPLKTTPTPILHTHHTRANQINSSKTSLPLSHSKILSLSLSYLSFCSPEAQNNTHPVLNFTTTTQLLLAHKKQSWYYGYTYTHKRQKWIPPTNTKTTNSSSSHTIHLQKQQYNYYKLKLFQPKFLKLHNLCKLLVTTLKRNKSKAYLVG